MRSDIENEKMNDEKEIDMNKRIIMLLVAFSCITLMGGCQKKEAAVVTKQPVLGEDVAGYVGFTHLTAYTMTGEDQTVVYLPASTGAYVGGTCIISKDQGVEVTVYQDPMLSGDVADKSVKQKLISILDVSYSNTFAKNMAQLERSDVEELENSGVFAETSYLVYDEDKEQYAAYWTGNYYVEMEDGREFQIIIQVNSMEKTRQTAEVISELEQYLGISLPYDEAAMQAKIDNYEPEGEYATFGVFKLYLPKGFKKNDFFNTVIKLFVGDVDQLSVYSDGENDFDFECLIYTGVMVGAGDISISAEAGALPNWLIQQIEAYMNDYMAQSFPDAKATDLKIIGQTKLGYVMQLSVYDDEGYDGYFYIIYRGESAYMIGGMIESQKSEEEKQEFYDKMEQMYSTIEVK